MTKKDTKAWIRFNNKLKKINNKMLKVNLNYIRHAKLAIDAIGIPKTPEQVEHLDYLVTSIHNVCNELTERAVKYLTSEDSLDNIEMRQS
jgi:hypothetical protein